MLSQSLHLPDMLPSPGLAELRGLQHSAICWDTEASAEGLAQGTGQHWALPPPRGVRARQCQQQEGAGSRADSEEQPSSCCPRTGSCGCQRGQTLLLSLTLLVNQSLSFPLPAASLLVQGCNMAKQAVLLPRASHLKELPTLPAFCYWIVFKLFCRFAMQFSCQV